MPPTPIDVDTLLARVLELTRSLDQQHVVALYTYGGFAKGQVDEWSDLDVCLVHQPTEEAADRARDWQVHLEIEFEFRVDPLTLSLDAIGGDSKWRDAFLLVCLLDRASLLLGRDIRDQIVRPSTDKQRLSVCMPGLARTRNVYSIPSNRPIPEQLPTPKLIPAMALPFGNVAWLVYVTVMQLLRAIIFLETGTMCHEKEAIGHELSRMGEPAMTDYFAQAMALRREVGRFEELTRVPARVGRLSHAIPELVPRLLSDMRTLQITDPTYVPSRSSGTP